MTEPTWPTIPGAPLEHDCSWTSNRILTHCTHCPTGHCPVENEIKAKLPPQPEPEPSPVPSEPSMILAWTAFGPGDECEATVSVGDEGLVVSMHGGSHHSLMSHDTAARVFAALGEWLQR